MFVAPFVAFNRVWVKAYFQIGEGWASTGRKSTQNHPA
jgi:hypothetical protein